MKHYDKEHERYRQGGKLVTTQRKDRILQIMPATGWRAVFKDGDGSEDSRPLVGWALVEEDAGGVVTTYTEGMCVGPDGNIECVDDINGFNRYEHVAGAEPVQ